MSGVTFETTKPLLQELLKDIQKGKIQLPDFQRGWVWDDDRIKSLLASLAVSFPIGAVMMLETGGDGVRFKPRPVEGTDPSAVQDDPEILILDGQQRLTSLYQSLMGTIPVQTRDFRGKAIQRWYYVDMNEAVAENADQEEAVFSLPEDRVEKKFGGEVGLDLSSPDKEYDQDCFPVCRMFNSASWRQAYGKHCNYTPEKMELFDKFEQEIIKRFEQYQLPVIELKKDTPKEAVCLVFEKVNTGGVPLNVFELLTASFAADNFQLRDDWQTREKRLKTLYPVLKTLQSDDFLQSLSLLVTQKRRREAQRSGVPEDRLPAISCKRRDLLKLEVEDYETWADTVEKGLAEAARFLHQQKIFHARDLPYRTQLVPLAAILADPGDEGDTDGARRKIARWFWCGVMGELYGGATETRFTRDLPDVVAYVQGGGEPLTVRDAHFAANRLLTLRTRNSAAYKGIYALLMRDGGLDFLSGAPIEAQAFFDDKIDIHHIFPVVWFKSREIDPAFFNSIINKTAISGKTNRSIGGNAPSTYLQALQRRGSIDATRMDEILRSHRIVPEYLRADNFWRFFETRGEALLECIEGAMEKSIPRVPGLFRQDTPVEEYYDGPVDWEEQADTVVEMEVAAAT